MISALMTKAKNPKVIIVKGSPKRLKTGFTIKFKSPRTIAKIIAVEKPSKCTPGKSLVSKNATIAVMSKRNIKFIVFNFLFLLKKQNLFQCTEMLMNKKII